MNIKPNVKASGIVALRDRLAQITARDLALDFPIYDIASRSLKQLLMVRPIANVLPQRFTCWRLDCHRRRRHCGGPRHR